MKKITIDNQFKQDIIKKFTDYLDSAKFTDNTLHFTTDISAAINTNNLPRPTVYISTKAYLKMMLYVRDTSTEIAWHGTVKRNKEENWYFIKDVFLYPQTLTATTVNTDQEKYQEWLQNIEDDDVFNNIRFQGHSHVNMGTSPSGTDINMYNSFLQVLPKNDYYIFAIMNKTGSFTCFIYDLEKNLIYETQDINIKIVADKNYDLIKNINEEKDKYCSKFEYNTQYNMPAYQQTSSWPWEKSSCQTTYVDRLFDDLDSKYKNPSLIQPIKKNKKHHK